MILNVESNLEIIEFILLVPQFKIYHLISHYLFWFMKFFLVYGSSHHFKPLKNEEHFENDIRFLEIWFWKLIICFLVYDALYILLKISMYDCITLKKFHETLPIKTMIIVHEKNTLLRVLFSYNIPYILIQHLPHL